MNSSEKKPKYGNYTTSMCDKCGKPFVYVGDIIGDAKDYVCCCGGTGFDGFPKLPELKVDMVKYKMMKALENLHQYFSEESVEISEETFELLEELFGELPYNWHSTRRNK